MWRFALLLLFFLSGGFSLVLVEGAEDHTGHDHVHHHEEHGHDHGSHNSSEADTSQPDPTTVIFQLLAFYAVLIAAASLFGGWLPTHVRLSHLSFQSLLSIVGGMLIGIGLFHLLPHAIHELGVSSVDFLMVWMMAGIITMFFLLRTLHVHHHEPPEIGTEESLNPQSSLHVTPCEHDHHDHHHHAGGVSWAGMFLGLSIHTLLDGLALGASMQADANHQLSGLLGLGVLVGIILHKPFDSLSFTTLMINAGQSKVRITLMNLLYSLLCPIGAALFLMGVWSADSQTSFIVGASLAFSAGIFLCIALADLLPEMEFHNHNRWRLSACLLLGVILAWCIRYLEPAHLH